jgi:Flp pilus assembly protein TadD
MPRSSQPRMTGVAILIALASACTHQRMVKATPAPAAGQLTVWDRQVRNAVDAGEGDYQLRALRQRVAGEPDNIAIRLELARAYRERGYPEIALEMSRLAAARFPASGEAQLSLVRDLRAVGRRAEAIAGLEGFLKEQAAAGSQYWSWLGILRDEAGLFAAAEPAHRKAIEIAPAADSMHNNLGYNLLLQNKPADAAAEFREALKLNPGSGVARNNLAIALAQSNAPAEAVATWQAGTDPASAHNNLAAVWMEKGNYPQARAELEVALGYNRAHPAALRNMELLTHLDGRPAMLPAGSPWSRWVTGMKRLFVGPLQEARGGAVKTADSR